MTALRRVVVGCLATALFPAMSWADGGAVVFSKLCGGYRITLFAAPPSPRAGPVDFSVLIQAVDSGAPVLDIPVSIHVCPEDAPQRFSRRTGDNGGGHEQIVPRDPARPVRTGTVAR